MKRMLPLAFTLCLLLCGCMSRTENRGVEKIGGADGITGIVVGDSRENDSSLGAFRVCTYEGPLYPDTFCYILTLKSRIYSGDGVFTLSPVDRADESLPSYSGPVYTTGYSRRCRCRGMAACGEWRRPDIQFPI